MKREMVSLALSALDDRHVTDTAVFSPESIPSSPERIVSMNKKRIITLALAAVLMLALGISAYAAWGASRSTGTHPMPHTAEYTSLSALPEVERDVGYPVRVPEGFSNGYAFSVLRVDGQAVFDENNEVLKEFYTVSATYSRDGASDLTLFLNPVLAPEGSEASQRTPSKRLTVGGTAVELNLDHYKLVPEDYEKTESDLAREAAGHYYISFGSDRIEEREIASADFTLDEVNYTLMDMAAKDASLDMLVKMAQEILEAAGA